MLRGYFETCANDSHTRNYLYREFSEHYVWKKQSKKWTKKKTEL